MTNLPQIFEAEIQGGYLIGEAFRRTTERNAVSKTTNSGARVREAFQKLRDKPLRNRAYVVEILDVGFKLHKRGGKFDSLLIGLEPRSEYEEVN